MNPTLPMYRRVVALATLAALLSGCQSAAPLLRKAEDYAQIAVSKARFRGETNLADGPRVARELGCGAQHTAAARLESSTVLPERPRAGREINHRLVIASCPLSGDDPPGVLTRRFTHQGRTLFEDSMPYTMKPGRWSLDVFVGIPDQAPPGPYRLEVKFARRGLQLESASDFVVQP